MKIFDVGEGKEKDEKEEGFKNVIEGGGDEVRIEGKMRKEMEKNERVIYIEGRVRKKVFEDEVEENGI